MKNNKFINIEELYDKIRRYFGIDKEDFEISRINMAYALESFYEIEPFYETEKEKIINCNSSAYYGCFFDLDGLYIEIEDEDLICIPFFNIDKTSIFNSLRELGYERVTVDFDLPIIKEIYNQNQSKKRVRS